MLRGDKTLRGRFIFNPGTSREIIVPNIIVKPGEESFLKMITRADVVDVPAGGNFYVGLCEQVPNDADTLASITTEPSSQGQYARNPITRDATGWPTIDQVGDAYRALSLELTFQAVGADFSRTFQRAFLCNVLSGTAGILYSYSGLLPNPVLITAGQSQKVKYELYMR